MDYPDFEINRLTHSIENVISGDSFPTEIISLTKPDLIQITKKKNCCFYYIGIAAIFAGIVVLGLGIGLLCGKIKEDR
jgi:hypothetical protein